MLTVDWDAQTGWHAPQILPHGPLKIEASSSCLHYGISCYEGLSIVRNEKTNLL
jgi:branched-chain amino acid aminotransferase